MSDAAPERADDDADDDTRSRRADAARGASVVGGAMSLPTHDPTHEPLRSTDSRVAPRESRVATLTFTLASLLLAAMALVAFGDVAMRVVGRPITGAYELTSLLVAALVYAGLPGVTLADEHVRAGIFASWVDQRPRLAAALRGLRRATTALTMGVLAYAMARYALKLAAVGDRAPFIELPLAWVAAFGAVLLALAAWLALRARATAAQDIRE